MTQSSEGLSRTFFFEDFLSLRPVCKRNGSRREWSEENIFKNFAALEGDLPLENSLRILKFGVASMCVDKSCVAMKT